MNDTTNTTTGGVPNSMPPQTSAPGVQPFSPALASPMTPPVAPVPSFGTTAPVMPAAWTPPTTPPVAQNTFSPAGQTPSQAAGSASWGGVPAPISSAPTTPTWNSTTPVSSMPPVTPNTTPSNDFKPEHEGKSKLPLVIAGILLVLAMAGGYFLYMLYQTPTTTPDEAPVVEAQATPTVAPSPTMTEEQQAQQSIDDLEKVSESDEVESLQKDVDDTNLTNIDSNLTPAAQ